MLPMPAAIVPRGPAVLPPLPIVVEVVARDFQRGERGEACLRRELEVPGPVVDGVAGGVARDAEVEG